MNEIELLQTFMSVESSLKTLNDILGKLPLEAEVKETLNEIYDLSYKTRALKIQTQRLQDFAKQGHFSMEPNKGATMSRVEVCRTELPSTEVFGEVSDGSGGTFVTKFSGSGFHMKRTEVTLSLSAEPPGELSANSTEFPSSVLLRTFSGEPTKTPEEPLDKTLPLDLSERLSLVPLPTFPNSDEDSESLTLRVRQVNQNVRRRVVRRRRRIIRRVVVVNGVEEVTEEVLEEPDEVEEENSNFSSGPVVDVFGRRKDAQRPMSPGLTISEINESTTVGPAEIVAEIDTGLRAESPRPSTKIPTKPTRRRTDWASDFDKEDDLPRSLSSATMTISLEPIIETRDGKQGKVTIIPIERAIDILSDSETQKPSSIPGRKNIVSEIELLHLQEAPVPPQRQKKSQGPGSQLSEKSEKSLPESPRLESASQNEVAKIRDNEADSRISFGNETTKSDPPTAQKRRKKKEKRHGRRAETEILLASNDEKIDDTASDIQGKPLKSFTPMLEKETENTPLDDRLTPIITIDSGEDERVPLPLEETAVLTEDYVKTTCPAMDDLEHFADKQINNTQPATEVFFTTSHETTSEETQTGDQPSTSILVGQSVTDITREDIHTGYIQEKPESKPKRKTKQKIYVSSPNENQKKVFGERERDSSLGHVNTEGAEIATDTPVEEENTHILQRPTRCTTESQQDDRTEYSIENVQIPYTKQTEQEAFENIPVTELKILEPKQTTERPETTVVEKVTVPDVNEESEQTFNIPGLNKSRESPEIAENIFTKEINASPVENVLESPDSKVTIANATLKPKPLSDVIPVEEVNEEADQEINLVDSLDNVEIEFGVHEVAEFVDIENDTMTEAKQKEEKIRLEHTEIKDDRQEAQKTLESHPVEEIKAEVPMDETCLNEGKSLENISGANIPTECSTQEEVEVSERNYSLPVTKDDITQEEDKTPHKHVELIPKSRAHDTEVIKEGSPYEDSKNQAEKLKQKTAKFATEDEISSTEIITTLVPLAEKGFDKIHAADGTFKNVNQETQKSVEAIHNEEQKIEHDKHEADQPVEGITIEEDSSQIVKDEANKFVEESWAQPLTSEAMEEIEESIQKTPYEEIEFMDVNQENSFEHIPIEEVTSNTVHYETVKPVHSIAVPQFKAVKEILIGTVEAVVVKSEFKKSAEIPTLEVESEGLTQESLKFAGLNTKEVTFKDNIHEAITLVQEIPCDKVSPENIKPETVKSVTELPGEVITKDDKHHVDKSVEQLASEKPTPTTAEKYEEEIPGKEVTLEDLKYPVDKYEGIFGEEVILEDVKYPAEKSQKGISSEPVKVEDSEYPAEIAVEKIAVKVVPAKEGKHKPDKSELEIHAEEASAQDVRHPAEMNVKEIPEEVASRNSKLVTQKSVEESSGEEVTSQDNKQPAEKSELEIPGGNVITQDGKPLAEQSEKIPGEEVITQAVKHPTPKLVVVIPDVKDIPQDVIAQADKCVVKITEDRTTQNIKHHAEKSAKELVSEEATPQDVQYPHEKSDGIPGEESTVVDFKHPGENIREEVAAKNVKRPAEESEGILGEEVTLKDVKYPAEKSERIPGEEVTLEDNTVEKFEEGIPETVVTFEEVKFEDEKFKEEILSQEAALAYFKHSVENIVEEIMGDEFAAKDVKHPAEKFEEIPDEEYISQNLKHELDECIANIYEKKTMQDLKHQAETSVKEFGGDEDITPKDANHPAKESVEEISNEEVSLEDVKQLRQNTVEEMTSKEVAAGDVKRPAETSKVEIHAEEATPQDGRHPTEIPGRKIPEEELAPRNFEHTAQKSVEETQGEDVTSQAQPAEKSEVQIPCGKVTPQDVKLIADEFDAIPIEEVTTQIFKHPAEKLVEDIPDEKDTPQDVKPQPDKFVTKIPVEGKKEEIKHQIQKCEEIPGKAITLEDVKYPAEKSEEIPLERVALEDVKYKAEEFETGVPGEEVTLQDVKYPEKSNEDISSEVVTLEEVAAKDVKRPAEQAEVEIHSEEGTTKDVRHPAEISVEQILEEVALRDLKHEVQKSVEKSPVEEVTSQDDRQPTEKSEVEIPCGKVTMQDDKLLSEEFEPIPSEEVTTQVVKHPAPELAEEIPDEEDTPQDIKHQAGRFVPQFASEDVTPKDVSHPPGKSVEVIPHEEFALECFKQSAENPVEEFVPRDLKHSAQKFLQETPVKEVKSRDDKQPIEKSEKEIPVEEFTTQNMQLPAEKQEVAIPDEEATTQVLKHPAAKLVEKSPYEKKTHQDVKYQADKCVPKISEEATTQDVKHHTEKAIHKLASEAVTPGDANYPAQKSEQEGFSEEVKLEQDQHPAESPVEEIPGEDFAPRGFQHAAQKCVEITLCEEITSQEDKQPAEKSKVEIPSENITPEVVKHPFIKLVKEIPDEEDTPQYVKLHAAKYVGKIPGDVKHHAEKSITDVSEKGASKGLTHPAEKFEEGITGAEVRLEEVKYPAEKSEENTDEEVTSQDVKHAAKNSEKEIKDEKVAPQAVIHPAEKCVEEILSEEVTLEDVKHPSETPVEEILWKEVAPKDVRHRVEMSEIEIAGENVTHQDVKHPEDKSVEEIPSEEIIPQEVIYLAEKPVEEISGDEVTLQEVNCQARKPVENIPSEAATLHDVRHPAVKSVEVIPSEDVIPQEVKHLSENISDEEASSQDIKHPKAYSEEEIPDEEITTEHIKNAVEKSEPEIQNEKITSTDFKQREETSIEDIPTVEVTFQKPEQEDKYVEDIPTTVYEEVKYKDAKQKADKYAEPICSKVTSKGVQPERPTSVEAILFEEIISQCLQKESNIHPEELEFLEEFLAEETPSQTDTFLTEEVTPDKAEQSAVKSSDYITTHEDINEVEECGTKFAGREYLKQGVEESVREIPIEDGSAVEALCKTNLEGIAGKQITIVNAKLEKGRPFVSAAVFAMVDPKMKLSEEESDTPKTVKPTDRRRLAEVISTQVEYDQEGTPTKEKISVEEMESQKAIQQLQESVYVFPVRQVATAEIKILGFPQQTSETVEIQVEDSKGETELALLTAVEQPNFPGTTELVYEVRSVNPKKDQPTEIATAGIQILGDSLEDLQPMEILTHEIQSSQMRHETLLSLPILGESTNFADVTREAKKGSETIYAEFGIRDLKNQAAPLTEIAVAEIVISGAVKDENATLEINNGTILHASPETEMPSPFRQEIADTTKKPEKGVPAEKITSTDENEKTRKPEEVIATYASLECNEPEVNYEDLILASEKGENAVSNEQVIISDAEQPTQLFTEKANSLDARQDQITEIPVDETGMLDTRQTVKEISIPDTRLKTVKKKRPKKEMIIQHARQQTFQPTKINLQELKGQNTREAAQSSQIRDGKVKILGARQEADQTTVTPVGEMEIQIQGARHYSQETAQLTDIPTKVKISDEKEAEQRIEIPGRSTVGENRQQTEHLFKIPTERISDNMHKEQLAAIYSVVKFLDDRDETQLTKTPSEVYVSDAREEAQLIKTPSEVKVSDAREEAQLTKTPSEVKVSDAGEEEQLTQFTADVKISENREEESQTKVSLEERRMPEIIQETKKEKSKAKRNRHARHQALLINKIPVDNESNQVAIEELSQPPEIDVEEVQTAYSRQETQKPNIPPVEVIQIHESAVRPTEISTLQVNFPEQKKKQVKLTQNAFEGVKNPDSTLKKEKPMKIVQLVTHTESIPIESISATQEEPVLSEILPVDEHQFASTTEKEKLERTYVEKIKISDNEVELEQLPTQTFFVRLEQDNKQLNEENSEPSRIVDAPLPQRIPKQRSYVSEALSHLLGTKGERASKEAVESRVESLAPLLVREDVEEMIDIFETIFETLMIQMEEIEILFRRGPLLSKEQEEKLSVILENLKLQMHILHNLSLSPSIDKKIQNTLQEFQTTNFERIETLISELSSSVRCKEAMELELTSGVTRFTEIAEKFKKVCALPSTRSTLALLEDLGRQLEKLKITFDLLSVERPKVTSQLQSLRKQHNELEKIVISQVEIAVADLTSSHDYKIVSNELEVALRRAEDLMSQRPRQDVVEDLEKHIEENNIIFLNLEKLVYTLQKVYSEVDETTRGILKNTNEEQCRNARTLLERAARRDAVMRRACMDWRRVIAGLDELDDWVKGTTKRLPNISSLSSGELHEIMRVLERLLVDFLQRRCHTSELNTSSQEILRVVDSPSLNRRLDFTKNEMSLLNKALVRCLRCVGGFCTAFWRHVILVSRLESSLVEAEELVVPISLHTKVGSVAKRLLFLREEAFSSLEEALEFVPVVDSTTLREELANVEDRMLLFGGEVEEVKDMESLDALSLETKDIRNEFSTLSSLVISEGDIYDHLDKIENLEARLRVTTKGVERQLDAKSLELSVTLLRSLEQVAFQLAKENNTGRMLLQKLCAFYHMDAKATREEKALFNCLHAWRRLPRNSEEALVSAILQLQEVEQSLGKRFGALEELRHQLSTFPTTPHLSCDTHTLGRSLREKEVPLRNASTQIQGWKKEVEAELLKVRETEKVFMDLTQTLLRDEWTLEALETSIPETLSELRYVKELLKTLESRELNWSLLSRKDELNSREEALFSRWRAFFGRLEVLRERVEAAEGPFEVVEKEEGRLTKAFQTLATEVHFPTVETSREEVRHDVDVCLEEMSQLQQLVGQVELTLSSNATKPTTLFLPITPRMEQLRKNFVHLGTTIPEKDTHSLPIIHLDVQPQTIEEDQPLALHLRGLHEELLRMATTEGHLLFLQMTSSDGDGAALLEEWEITFERKLAEYLSLWRRALEEVHFEDVAQLAEELLEAVEERLSEPIPGRRETLFHESAFCNVTRRVLLAQKEALDPSCASVVSQQRKLVEIVKERSVETEQRLLAWDAYTSAKSALDNWLRNFEREKSNLELPYIAIHRLPAVKQSIETLISGVPRGETLLVSLKKSVVALTSRSPDAIKASLSQELVNHNARLNNLEAALRTWLDRVNRLSQSHTDFETMAEDAGKRLSESQDRLDQINTPFTFSEIRTSIPIFKEIQCEVTALGVVVEGLEGLCDKMKASLTPADFRLLRHRVVALNNRRLQLLSDLLERLTAAEEKENAVPHFDTKCRAWLVWADGFRDRLDRPITSEVSSCLEWLEELEEEMVSQETTFVWLVSTGEDLCQLTEGKELKELRRVLQEVAFKWNTLSDTHQNKLTKTIQLKDTIDTILKKCEGIYGRLEALDSCVVSPLVFIDFTTQSLQEKTKELESSQRELSHTSSEVNGILSMGEVALSDAEDMRLPGTATILRKQLHTVEKRWSDVIGNFRLREELLLSLRGSREKMETACMEFEDLLGDLEGRLDGVELGILADDDVVSTAVLQGLVQKLTPAIDDFENNFVNLMKRLEPYACPALTSRIRGVLTRWTNVVARSKNLEILQEKVRLLANGLQTARDVLQDTQTEVEALLKDETCSHVERTQALETLACSLAKHETTEEELRRLSKEISVLAPDTPLLSQFVQQEKNRKTLQRNLKARMKSLKKGRSKLKNPLPVQTQSSSCIQIIEPLSAEGGILPTEGVALQRTEIYRKEYERALAEGLSSLESLKCLIQSQPPKKPTPEQLTEAVGITESSIDICLHFQLLANEDSKPGGPVDDLVHKFQDLERKARACAAELRAERGTGKGVSCPVCSPGKGAACESTLWRLRQWLQHAEGTLKQTMRNRPPNNIEELEDAMLSHRELLLDLESHRPLTKSLSALLTHTESHLELDGRSATAELESLREKVENSLSWWKKVCHNAASWQLRLQMALMENPDFGGTVGEYEDFLESVEDGIRDLEPVNLGSSKETLLRKHQSFQELKERLLRTEPGLQTLQQTAEQLFVNAKAIESDGRLVESRKAGERTAETPPCEDVVDRIATVNHELRVQMRLLDAYTTHLGETLEECVDGKHEGKVLNLSQQIPVHGRSSPLSTHKAESGESSEERGRRGYLFRALRASLPLQALILLLLGAATLLPFTEQDFSCFYANTFANSLDPMLAYPNGPPRI